MAWIESHSKTRVNSGVNMDLKNNIVLKFKGICYECKKQGIIELGSTQLKRQKGQVHLAFTFENGKRIPMEIHHKIPYCIGGKDKETNLLLLCRSCHRKIYHKGNNSPSKLSKRKNNVDRSSY